MPRPKRTESDANRPRRVTLQDVAKAANLHVMTVSDALSGKRAVASATRERVQRIARELNYVPNQAAKALSTGRTSMVAIMCGSLHEAYYANLVAFLEKLLRGDRYLPILMRRPEELKELLATTNGLALDGVITIDMDSSIDAEAILKPLSHAPAVPCVSIGTYPWELTDSVLIDMSVAVTAAVSIMLAAGRRRVAYLTTHEVMALPQETRAGAYYATMADWGLTPEIINTDTIHPIDIEPEIRSYLQTHGCPDGLMCLNDDSAMAAYRAVRSMGFRVPEDVMIVGCDGQLTMRYFDPPLSTVVQPLEEICSVAWKFLKRRMANPSIPHQRTVLEGELVIRESLSMHREAIPRSANRPGAEKSPES